MANIVGSEYASKSHSYLTRKKPLRIKYQIRKFLQKKSLFIYIKESY